jgi:HSP20 family protein
MLEYNLLNSSQTSRNFKQQLYMRTSVNNFDHLSTFPSLFNGIFNEPTYAPKQNSPYPAANIKEDDATFFIDLAAPGFRKEIFKIEINNRTLTVSAEQTAENETLLRREFLLASFARSFKLPNTADVDKIEASYEDGILCIQIPKKEEAKAKEPRLVAIN